VILIVFANLAVLLVVGVPVATIALAHGYGLVCFGLGRAFWQRTALRAYAGDDRGAVQIATQALLGFVAHGAVLGVALHWTTQPAVLSAGLWLLAACAVASNVPLRLDPDRESERGPLVSSSWLTSGILEASLALLVCTCTIYGFNNTPNPQLSTTDFAYGEVSEPRPNWGWQGDKGVHLVELPDQLMTEGLPGPSVAHRGVQLSTLPIALYTGSYQARDVVDGFKAIAFYVWLALLVFVRALGRDVYRLRGFALEALVASCVFLGAINYPLLETRASTYAGFVKPTLGAFHNLTQLLSLLVGGAGFYFLLDAFGNRRRAVPLGVVLLACSFFYKPSLFVLVAPLVVAAGVLWFRALSPTERLWILALCLIPAGWMFYVRLAGAGALSLSPGFAPFLLYFGRAAWRFPEWVTSSPLLFAAAIVLCSFLFAVLVSVPWLGRVRQIHFRREELVALLPIAIFLVGVVASLVLVENNHRHAHGNFAWLGHSAYFLALPLFFRCWSELKSPVYRALCLVVLLAHLGAGVQHLVFFTTEAKIV
jgi:hypothetical protein